MGTKYVVDGDSLTSVANAIRTKGGTSAQLEFPTEFVTAIGNISGGGTPRTSADLQVSGSTVTAPAGTYASDASKSVTTMTLPTSSSSSATSGYGLKATFDRSTSDRYLNIAPGYNASGGYYKISKVSNGSATAPASITGSSATVSTGTNTLTLSKTISVTPSVTAGYISSGTAGNASVSLTASVTTKAAATYHPSTSDQTVSASQYLTGAQTIKAVTMSNLTAANIKKDVVVKIGDSTDDDCVTSITGTYEGGTSKNVQYYSGYGSVKNTGYASTSVKLTVAKTGNYKVTWTGWRGSSSGTMGSQLYVGSTGQGANETFTGTYGQVVTISSISLTQGQTITVYAKSGNTSRTMYVANLIIEEQTIT